MTHIQIDDTLTNEDLRERIEFERRPTVSLFLPTHSRPEDGVRSATLLKSLLGDARAALSERPEGLDAADIESILAPARVLVDERSAWIGADGGLALHLAPGYARGVRLPEAPGSEYTRARVGDRFRVLPLAEALADDHRFHLLALSENDVHFFRGDRDGLEEVGLPETPSSVEEAAPVDDVPEDLQFHTGTGGGGGRRPAVYHGQERGEKRDDERVRRFLRAVAAGVTAVRSEHEDVPLLLACVDRLAARLVETVGELASDPSPVAGPLANTSGESLEELHRAAWARASEHIARQNAAALDAARAAAAVGRGATDFDSVYAAAARGQVDALWIVRGIESRGVREGLVDALVAEVIERGGTARFFDGEDPASGLLATFRFAVDSPTEADDARERTAQ